MYLMLMNSLAKLIVVQEIRSQHVPNVTGTGVTKTAMMLFMKDNENFQTVSAGTYIGVGGRSITVVGSRHESDKFILHESVKDKMEDYVAMNMNPFVSFSCFHMVVVLPAHANT